MRPVKRPLATTCAACWLAGALALVSLNSQAQVSAEPAAPAPATAASSAMAPPAAPVSSRVGTFKQIEGEAWLGVQDKRRPANPGDGVHESDRLSTGKTGVATLTLKDGTVLTLGPGTTVDLNRFQFDTTTQEGSFLLDLLQGSVRVVTGLLGKIHPELFKVKTPTSVVGVRGTDFIVETQAAR